MDRAQVMPPPPPPASGAGGAQRNALVFVQIPTHFREMIRVAELLQDAPGFRPVVLFMANYTGVQDDIKRCTDRGIRVIAADELYTYLPRPRARRRYPVLEALSAAGRRVAAASRVAWWRITSAISAAVGGAAAARSRGAARAGAFGARVRRMLHATRELVVPPMQRFTGLVGRSLLAVVLWIAQLAVAFRRILPLGLRDWLRPHWTVAGQNLRAWATVAWLAAIAPRSIGLGPVAHAMRRRLSRTFAEVRDLLRLAGRAAGRAFAKVRTLPARAGRRLALWAAPHVRRVLLWRIPSLASMQWLQRLPSPVRMALIGFVGGLAKILWILAIPLLPIVRRIFTGAFSIAYSHAPDVMPGDIRAQHYVWRIVPRLLDENEIDLVLLPEDNFYYFTNLFVKGIHARGGRAVIVPFTIVNVLEWAEAFKSLLSHDAEILMNRVVAMLFPQWCYRHKGKLLVMPPQQVLSNEALGVAPPIPWLINSGQADAIAAESLFMARYYQRAGIPEDKIRFTGALADDVLHRMLAEAPARRAALYRELDLPADRPMILCALPPNQLAGDGRPMCAFTDYLELLAAFVEPLERMADDYNIVVSLHPRITPAQARVLEGRRLRIARQNVAELIPLSRIYVACCSATIRLAISSGVPVVNYDVFVYDYDDFKGVPGVVTVDNQAAYEGTLERVARQPEDYARLRQMQLDFAREQTILDGKAGERMIALLDTLAPSRAPA